MNRLAAATLLASALFLAGPAPSARAGEDPAKDLAALQASYDGSTKGWKERFEEFKPQYEKFAGEHAGTEAALTAKLFLLQGLWWLRPDDAAMHAQAAKMADGILAEFPRSEQVARIAEMGWLFDREAFRGVLAKLSEETRPAPVRAAALLARAVPAARAGRTADAAPLLHEIVEKYAKVARGTSTYGEIADAWLHRHDAADLVVGKPAPEIVGRSIDGKPMRLSELRGRVVVIDFFGDW